MLQIFQKWTLFRALRLAVGLLLLTEALRSQNWFMVAAAAVLIIMPMLAAAATEVAEYRQIK